MAHNGQRLRGPLAKVCAALILLASPAFAGNEPQSAPSAQPAAGVPSNPDFLLGSPRATIGVRGNWLIASAGSDIFDFVTDQLTLEKSSFNTGSFAAEVGVSLSSRADVLLGIDLNRLRKGSEYRAVIDNFGLPIEQTTELSQTNLTASVKFAVLPKGRAVSRLAWIPRTVVPYVGAGGGIGKYKFLQTGDFVDFADNGVFADVFKSEGWTPLVHAFGGTDVRVLRHMLLSFEGRYTWSTAELEQDFIGFDPIDLGGLKFGVGVHFVF
jgi:hypothetical protein